PGADLQKTVLALPARHQPLPVWAEEHGRVVGPWTAAGQIVHRFGSGPLPDLDPVAATRGQPAAIRTHRHRVEHRPASLEGNRLPWTLERLNAHESLALVGDQRQRALAGAPATSARLVEGIGRPSEQPNRAEGQAIIGGTRIGPQGPAAKTAFTV